MTAPVTAARRRRALLLACASFSDPAFPPLRSPEQDVYALRDVLAGPGGSGYEVETLVNCTSQEAELAIERFFRTARPADSHLLYFSCHGVQSPQGDLFFAFTDTQQDFLGATAVSASWVRDRLQASRSKATTMLIDCCFSGAFLRGMQAKSAPAPNVGALMRDLPEGSGVAVLTASGETEFSLEDSASGQFPVVKPSYFTEAIVAGIASGEADATGDGIITVDELYDYVYDRVVSGPSPQRPRKMRSGEGVLIVAQRPPGGWPGRGATWAASRPAPRGVTTHPAPAVAAPARSGADQHAGSAWWTALRAAAVWAGRVLLWLGIAWFLLGALIVGWITWGDGASRDEGSVFFINAMFLIPLITLVCVLVWDVRRLLGRRR
ncbi:caspase family protein [Catenuloplanes atrovinosus]|uniref:Peptidase C14 caspase domain-containing protein n=1 Tax=Catenuloplanes atrovinosus TaxID=137266 RepID=A0AAE3YRF4_9ACTN|nr:caspase family protein [Catenuloplanes atrovinosus]MDR7277277.1 hypothetical protein [Catenuloplanes atrovinosus]